jgi:hypothetical protein
MTSHSSPHLSLHHSLRTRPPRCPADNRLPNRTVVEAHPRSTTPKGSGVAACAKPSSMMGTNASDILGMWESRQCVSPAGKSCAAERTIENDITPNTARGWILGEMGISDLRMPLLRSKDILRGVENDGIHNGIWFYANLSSQIKVCSLVCCSTCPDFASISFQCLVYIHIAIVTPIVYPDPTQNGVLTVSSELPGCLP